MQSQKKENKTKSVVAPKRKQNKKCRTVDIAQWLRWSLACSQLSSAHDSQAPPGVVPWA